MVFGAGTKPAPPETATVVYWASVCGRRRCWQLGGQGHLATGIVVARNRQRWGGVGDAVLHLRQDQRRAILNSTQAGELERCRTGVGVAAEPRYQSRADGIVLQVRCRGRGWRIGLAGHSLDVKQLPPLLKKPATA